MQHQRYSTEGIVLSQINYGEADRIITLLTKDHGKVRVIAKGIRKLKSRKRGHIDLFNQLRFSANRGKDLDIITEAELIETHSELKIDLPRVSVAYYLVEIVTKLTQIDEKNDFLYYFLASKLHELRDTKALKTFRFDCARELLVRLGFLPEHQRLDNPDEMIEDLIERKLTTLRVGKQVLL